MWFREIQIRPIFDSRAEFTLEAVVTDESGRRARAAVPSGRSRGRREAAVLDFAEAAAAVEDLKQRLTGRDFASLDEWDRLLGTGSNLTLVLSLAAARLFALAEGCELHEFLADHYFGGRRQSPPPTPQIFANFINGGAHAQNSLAFQEYMLVGGGDSPIQTTQELVALYKKLEEILRVRLGRTAPLGDEGGFSPDFIDEFEPLQVLHQLIGSPAAQNRWRLGLDVAASNFYRDNVYWVGDRRLSAEELGALFEEACRRFPDLYSLEDPFAEDDPAGFGALRHVLSHRLIVGDDLTVTDAALIEKYAGENLINAVIVKPNQIGTMSAACRAILAAEKYGLKTIISHRSGETEDNFIIELARAGGVFGVKIGPPIRERIYKYNTLIRLYEK